MTMSDHQDSDYYDANVSFVHWNFVITTTVVCEQMTEECAVRWAKSTLNDNCIPKWMQDSNEINVEWL